MASCATTDHRPQRTLHRLPVPARKDILLLVFALGAGALPAAVEPAEVFRCTSPDGAVEFRQAPCRERDSSTRIDIDDSPTGWVPPVPAAGPRPSRSARPRFTKPAQVEQDPALADRCWKKQRQLDAVNRQLRAGYKPVQGERLRRRRRDYEAYIHRFCTQ